MPPISKQKRDKISEQILHYLFSISLSAVHTSQIANEIIRDEEFTKSLLIDLEKNKLVARVTKSPKGIDYSRRERWRLSDKAYNAYKNIRNN